MSINAKVALDKQNHPERFCKVSRCLWRVVKLDHATQTYSLRPDCPNDYCPRHTRKTWNPARLFVVRTQEERHG